MVSRRYLYLIAALIWGIPGITITLKGINAYSNIQPSQLWWLLVATACTVIFFFCIFRRVTKRYIEHIAILPDRCLPFQTFPFKGWVLILFMMGLGITLKFIPSVPLQFIASFYSGLGPMLILSAFRFVLVMVRNDILINAARHRERPSTSRLKL